MKKGKKQQNLTPRPSSSLPSTSIRKTFGIPATLVQARELGFADSHFTDAQIASVMPHPQSIILTTDGAVPIGHFWKPGPVDGDFMLACYRNETDGCHWVKVPAAAPPEWDPHPDDD